MLVERDLAALGLSGTPSENDVRRAYLRQVKLHPPERDPDGFREVREAYERLQQQLRVQQVLASLPIAATPPVVPTSPEPEMSTPPVVAAPPEVAAELEVAAEPEGFVDVPEPEMERINSALERDDPDAAAASMIELYRKPLSEAAPVPPPIFVLQTFLVLVERGGFERARQLLAAFDAYVSATHLSFTGEVAALWKLAQEVAAVSELDAELASALAKGLRLGKLHQARHALENADARLAEGLQPRMSRKAPTLWASVAPLLQPVPRETPNFRQGFDFWGSTWVWRLILPVLFAFFRMCEPSNWGSHSSSDYNRVVTHTFDEHSDSRAIDPPPLPDGAAPQLAGTWSTVDNAIGIGDCQTVREQWPLYIAATRVAHVTEAESKDRAGRVLAMCPELKELVETPP
ncbi:MAG TPA: J domain-containing protein [Polyangiaceae bacterium]|nr:J domain-containing protein [Polyangiaceae bacterium]